jgi:hypothetical protein
MAEFRVAIEGLELDDETTRSLNDSIQKVVLSHLADHNLTFRGKERGVIAFRPHPDWYGLIAQIVDQSDLRQVPGIERTLEQFG